MSEKGDIFRLAITKAENLENPCIQITPSSGSMEDWAKLFYMISETTEQIGEKLRTALYVSIQESQDTQPPKPQCSGHTDGFHEIMVFNEGKNAVCVYCGETFRITRMSKEDVHERLKQSSFMKDKLIGHQDDEPF